MPDTWQINANWWLAFANADKALQEKAFEAKGQSIQGREHSQAP
jgi:hypothetical protein